MFIYLFSLIAVSNLYIIFVKSKKAHYSMKILKSLSIALFLLVSFSLFDACYASDSKKVNNSILISDSLQGRLTESGYDLKTAMFLEQFLTGIRHEPFLSKSDIILPAIQLVLSNFLLWKNWSHSTMNSPHIFLSTNRFSHL